MFACSFVGAVLQGSTTVCCCCYCCHQPFRVFLAHRHHRLCGTIQPDLNFSSVSLLLQIIWANRLEGDTYDRCLVTVDGTHFRIKNRINKQTGNYIKAWYSHKFRAAAVCYEIAVCIKTSDIVFINGPFPAATNDISIFRYKLRDMLSLFEKIMGDRGYRGDSACLTPLQAINCQHKRSMAALRARHETVNRRFKTFGALTHTFRQSPHQHHKVF